ncbi:hypothetical protein [Vibrio sp. Hal054]|uniref:hypothetical protein n=1 Tax=Vibrio sp. Hal054 TaxID=3035158 RepID=UPI00301C961D
MNILIADVKGLGAFPDQKDNRLTKVYLITARDTHPDKAKFAVFATCINASMALEIGRTETAQKHLASEKSSVWLIDCIESRKAHRPVWMQYNETLNNDYYTKEHAELRELFQKKFAWANVTAHGECLAGIVGVAPFNIRYINSNPTKTKGTKKSATKYNAASIAYLTNVCNDYCNGMYTISTHENPVPPLDDAYAKVGKDHIDAGGFSVERINVEQRGHSYITKKSDYILRHNAKRRQQTTEPARAGHNGVNIKDPLLRAKVNNDWVYFTHKSMPTSYGLAEVLALAFPETLGKVYKQLQEAEGKKPVLAQLFGERKDVIANAEAIKTIRALEIEGLTVQGEWKPFDLTTHNMSLIGSFIAGESDIDVTPKDVYSITDAHRAKVTLAKRKYGRESFGHYLLHPMHPMHLSFRAECGHYYWMKWCESTAINFTYSAEG